MPPPAQVAPTLIAAALVVLAVGVTRMSNSGGDAGDEPTSPLAQPAAASGADDEPAEIPPSQPAVPVSFAASGEIIRPAPEAARVIDPETGEEVVITVPPGGVLTAPPSGTPSTRPGSGTTPTTGGGTPTTERPTTTGTPTTQTTTTTTDGTTTTSSASTTSSTTTTTAAGEGLGGLLDGVGDLLGL